MTVQLKDMKIYEVTIITFSNSYKESNVLNSTNLEWERFYGNPNFSPCHTMKISKDIVKEGIKSINFGIKSHRFGPKTALAVFMHEVGLLMSDLPSVSPYMTVSSGTLAPVETEVVDLLQYSGQPCTRDINYRLDHCLQNLIYRVSQ